MSIYKRNYLSIEQIRHGLNAYTLITREINQSSDSASVPEKPSSLERKGGSKERNKVSSAEQMNKNQD